MKLLSILLLLLLNYSCGKNEDGGKRCFTREEAINYCAAQEMAEVGITLDVARMLCVPHYPYNSCYDLSAKGK